MKELSVALERKLFRGFLVLGLTGVFGLGVTLGTARASCTFTSNTTQYYVAANTTKDVSGCGTITLNKPLHILQGATLKGTRSDRINTTMVEGDFIIMYSGSTLKNLTVDGAWVADHVIRVTGRSDVWIENCIVQNSDHTRGTLTSKGAGSHLILVTDSQFVHIVGNTTQNAGWHPTYQASGSGLNAAGIYVYGSENVEISRNIVRRTLTAGIDFTDSVGARVIGNDIRDNGLNWVSGTGGSADPITAYHNVLHPNGIADFVIHGNYIKDHRHWGMHVSGRGLTITNNQVVTNPAAGTGSAADTDRQLSSLNIGDQRNDEAGPPNCSALVKVTGNNLGKPNGEDGKYGQSVYLWGPYVYSELTTSYLTSNNTLAGGVGGSGTYCAQHGSTDPFSDDNNRTLERASEWAYAIGLTGGCSTGRMCPTSLIRRKHMALFLYRLLHERHGFVEPAAGANSFTDDDSLSPAYRTAIEWMKVNRITNGCTVTTFCPESYIRRDHMVVFLYRALKNFREFEAAPGGDGFWDTSRYELEIGWAEANGITNGCGGGRFCPDSNLNREQLFAFLNRAATKTVY